MNHALISLDSTDVARKTLSSLLLDGDDLLRLPGLQREYARKQEEAAKEFQNVSRQQRRSHEAALDGLKGARGALANLNRIFAEIHELDNDSRVHNPISSNEPAYDSQLLRRLAMVHSNINETYRSAEAVARLPEAASRAEEMISSMNLVEAHVYLSRVEATVHKIKNAMTELMGSQETNETNHNVISLEPYFKRVDASMTKFEHKLWWIIRSFMDVDLDRRALVAALQVIETQELVDSKLVANGLGDCPLRKGWRHRCMENMSNAISEKTIHVLQRCSKLNTDGVGEELGDLLGEAGRILQGVDRAVDRVHECFPERYQIRDFLRKESWAFKDNILGILASYSDRMSNGDILFVLDWAMEGEEGDKGATETVPLSVTMTTSTTSVFTDQYLTRMDRALRNWLKNILTADFEGNPKSDAKGQLFTPGPQDMFRLIEEQQRFVSGNAVLRTGVRKRVGAILKEYLLEEYRRRIDVEENLEVLCAVCNNLLVLDDLLAEFQLDGFTQQARDAAMRFGRVIYLDPGFAQLFEGFFSDNEGWKRTGTRTGSLMATLEDFMADFRIWLGTDMGDICTKEVADGCCRYYVASLLSGLSVIDSATIDRMDDDLSKMRDKFGLDSVGFEVIEGIREFFSSDSVESFVIGWSSLLDSGGLGGPALGMLQGLVHKRVDLTRADCREIIDALQSTNLITGTSGDREELVGLVGLQDVNEGLRRDAQFSTAWKGLYW